MNRTIFKAFSLLIVLCLATVNAFAGGPLIVGGPAVGSRAAFGIDGQPFTWNPAKMPIQYRVDPGAMATSPSGTVVISNASGLQRLQAMFGIWQSVSTASVSFSYAGALLSAGSYTGGDLKTVAQLNDVAGSCKSATQNPVIFDSDGSLMSALGLPSEVIGFTSACAFDQSNGFISAALIVLNGKFQDGIDAPTTTVPNYELTANEFDEAITHEMGHLIGLDHAQINLNLLTSYSYPCAIVELAGLPLMFPEELCQARKDAGLPVLAPDDVAWVSKLYPAANQASAYGTISGYIFFSDGVSAVQGANVIARRVDDPFTSADESRRVGVSVVSGYLFTGNPGQSVTASMTPTSNNNTFGALNGSRNPRLIGYYEIPVPPGSYTVEVESVYPSFQSDSGIGPLNPPVVLPGPAEFWNLNESAFDFPLQRDIITINAGDKLSNIDIILNSTSPRFDQFEDTSSLILPPFVSGPQGRDA